jgi:hypothetical protein
LGIQPLLFDIVILHEPKNIGKYLESLADFPIPALSQYGGGEEKKN